MNDFVEALHSAEVIDTLEYMLDIVDNNDDTNITDCVDEVVDMFTSALHEATDPICCRRNSLNKL